MKGSSVYVTAKELESLHDISSYLSAILEASSGDVAHLIAAKSGLHSVIEKAGKSKRAAVRRKAINAALRAAENE
jgi:DNA-binding phage protein